MVGVNRVEKMSPGLSNIARGPIIVCDVAPKTAVTGIGHPEKMERSRNRKLAERLIRAKMLVKRYEAHLGIV